MKDYSQNNEQKIILDYFGDFRGAVLDIGANDGVTLSNSRALVALGWRAVLVEPSPAAFVQLHWNNVTTKTGRLPEQWKGAPQDFAKWIADKLEFEINPLVTLVNAAITTADGLIDLYDSGTHLKKGDVALLSTTVPKEMDRWKKSGETFTKTTVRGITFETLMKETGVNKFEFISIDCEGADYDVLKQIDLRAVGCRMLCIEYNASPVAESLMRAYCAAHGIRVLHKNHENLIFVTA